MVEILARSASCYSISALEFMHIATVQQLALSIHCCKTIQSYTAMTCVGYEPLWSRFGRTIPPAAFRYPHSPHPFCSPLMPCISNKFEATNEASPCKGKGYVWAWVFHRSPATHAVEYCTANCQS